jgi:hypothetical protein
MGARNMMTTFWIIAPSGGFERKNLQAKNAMVDLAK